VTKFNEGDQPDWEQPLGIELPRLTDYRVRIPPGGKTGALVETIISWAPARARRAGESFTTCTTPTIWSMPSRSCAIDLTSGSRFSRLRTERPNCGLTEGPQ